MNIVTVGEIATQVRGVSYGKADVQDRPAADYLPVLRANNITENGLFFEDLVFVKRGRVKNAQRLKAGDILVAASSGSLSVVGKAAQVHEDKDAAFGAFCKVVRPGSKVDPAYLGHFFRTPSYRSEISSLAAGANINNLRSEHIDNLAIPLPPLPEQRRIATILDQADALRRLRRQSLSRLSDLGQAIFFEMFGDGQNYDIVTLGDLVCSDDKLNYGVVQPGPDVEEGVPLVRAGDLCEPDLNLINMKKISTDVERAYKRSRLKGDEILIACVGSIGTVALASLAVRGANIARAVARVPLDPQISEREFIATQLRSANIQRYFKRETRTVSQPTLNIKQVKETKVFLPALSDQKRFVRRLHDATKATDAMTSALKNSDLLFASLQHRAFRGEL